MYRTGPLEAERREASDKFWEKHKHESRMIAISARYILAFKVKVINTDMSAEDKGLHVHFFAEPGWSGQLHGINKITHLDMQVNLPILEQGEGLGDRTKAVSFMEAKTVAAMGAEHNYSLKQIFLFHF